jgi:hypothetical protein
MAGAARTLYDLGYHDLVSVIPPGAELAPRSRIKRASLGKVPGRRGPGGVWAGYSWDSEIVEAVADEIDQMGANIGLRARSYPAIDIDSDSNQLTIIVVNTLHEVLGKRAPCRMSTGARRLFVFRTEEPFRKRVLEIMLQDGSSHAVELLGDGQQYLIYGTHPSGSPYNFPHHPLPKDPGDLPLIDEQLVDSFFMELAAFLQQQGASVSLQGSKSAVAKQLDEEEIPEGSRNVTLASVAGTMQRRGLPPAAIFAALMETNLQLCHPPLDAEDVQTIVDSISRYKPEQPLVVKSAANDFEVQPDAVEEPDPPVFEEATPDQMAVWVIPKEKWLLEDLIPTGGSSLLVAKPKVGKSTFARGLAVSMAKGIPFMDRDLRPMKVMYVMFPNEGTKGEAQEELIGRLKANEGRSKKNFKFYYNKSLMSDKDAIVRFLGQKAEAHRPDVIFIDTLQGLVLAKDLNGYAEVHAAFAPIRAVAEPYGAHLCYLHHAGKGDKIDLIDLSLGSTALAGSVTVLMAMKRDATEETLRLFAARGRGVEFPAHVVHVDEESHMPLLGASFLEYRLEQTETAVMAGLAENEGGPLTRTELLNASGKRHELARKAIDALVKSGAINLTLGKYTLPNASDEFEKVEVPGEND